MSGALFLALPGSQALAARLAALCQGEEGLLEAGNFPDGEWHLRYAADLAGRDVVLVATLARPNALIPALMFAADAARELHARRIGLVAPYLCYMRQDRRFRPGEAVTSRSFAQWIAGHFDWLVTVDPHLHRYHALADLYSIPALALHAGPLLAGWIKDNIANPFLIGPDEESRQWVGAVAAACGAPFAVLSKTRLGDRDVVIAPPQFLLPAEATPVFLDDIISSGATMLEAIRRIAPARRAVVVAVHGLFGEGAQALVQSGIRLATTDTVPNPHAVMEIAPLIASGLAGVTDR